MPTTASTSLAARLMEVGIVSENVGQSADVKCDCNFYRALDCVLWVHVNLQNLEFNAGKLKSVDFDP